MYLVYFVSLRMLHNKNKKKICTTKNIVGRYLTMKMEIYRGISCNILYKSCYLYAQNVLVIIFNSEEGTQI